MLAGASLVPESKDGNINNSSNNDDADPSTSDAQASTVKDKKKQKVI